MIPTRPTRPAFVLTIFALLSGTMFSGPALALDGNDLLARINALYSDGGSRIEAQAVEVNGSDVVLKGASVIASAGPGQPDRTVGIGDVLFSGVAERGDGGYTVGAVTLPDFLTSEQGMTVNLRNLRITGLVIPADPDADTLESMAFYDEASMGPLTISSGGTEVLSVQSATAAMTPAPDGSGFSFSTRASGIHTAPGQAGNPSGQEAARQLGLAEVNGDLDLAGTWTAATGTFDIERLTFDADNIGRLDLTLNLSGYTFDLRRSLRETARSVKSNPNREAAQQAGGIAMMGILQQLELNRLRLRFDDGGITGRVLDHTGRKQGISGEQLAQAAGAMIPLALAQYGIADPQNRIGKPLGDFLSDPRNLTVSIEPEQPLPLISLIGTLSASPAALLTLPGTTITANQ